MKFRDGMWAVAEGVRVEYAEEVYDITETDKGLSLLCPSKKIRGRGDTLNCSTLTIDLEAPHDGIISVETTHWAGAARKGPNFQLFPQGGQKFEPKISKSDKGTTLSSGSLSATINPADNTFGIKFHSTEGSKVLTSLAARSVGLAYNPAWSNMLQTGDMTNFKHYVFTQTNLGVGETIHGLGERFGAFNKVGQAISLWNADGGTSSEQAYKNVSFWLSNRGYGVFIDTPGKVELEIGSERCCRAQTSIEGQRLKWYIIYGPSPKEVLHRYSILTGRPAKVPSWSYGLWLTTSFTTNYDEATVNSFLEGMKERDIQVDVFHYDCFWMKGFRWTDFIFDPEKFPDPKAQIARLKSSGLVSKVCVWINPYIAQHGAAFAHAAEKGYLVKRKNGDIWQWDLWQAGMGLVDFTNPEAVKWYVECLNELFDKGVDCIKTDFGERIPTLDVEWFDKEVDPHKMHNYYAYLYNKIVYNALQARYGETEAVLFARAACAGTQQFPLVWGGDCESTPEAMAESIRGGLGLGLSGFTFWSNDIGGFEGSPAPWIYKRWVAFGLLCSHSRLHGSGSYRVPWLIDNDDRSPEGCSAVLAKWTALKTRLMPYLMAQGVKAVEAGLPLSVRAMCVEFPEDPTCWYLDRQFMIGESLLAAPVFEEAGEVEFYLPKGKWTCFFTEQTREGPGWFRETHGFGSMPLYVREHTMLVLGKEGIRGAVYNYKKDVEVLVFKSKDNKTASADIVGSDGSFVGTLKESDFEVGAGQLLEGNSTIRRI
ncbi:glycoside hydrolase family 31 protein [Annulohypoxylon maeteangense]|uniref:glycoside hydrolase family 31 protein n=1 Tax=Annulohypoxylon maeteangense TaxID=1927788 RepID=UPI0020086ED5|nr:glycoside hydrolase family 31 protein [Annulohypoxylon maeteangense]KAI0888473.1 glycoside hydrolase family 31 protein [Annulohypoxylon maeteangense]